MNVELNSILENHLSKDLPKALKTQKSIKWSLQYLVPIVASLLFLGVLAVGFIKFSSSIQSVLLVILASLLLPLWVVMPVAKLFTCKEFVALDNTGLSRAHMHLNTMAPHLDPLIAQRLNELLSSNSTPAAWWEDLEKKTSGSIARLFVQSLEKTPYSTK